MIHFGYDRRHRYTTIQLMPNRRPLVIVMAATLVLGCGPATVPVQIVDGSTLTNADCNQDGVIDQPEVAQFREVYTGFPGEVIGEGPINDSRFWQADTERDGKLALPELQDLLRGLNGWKFVRRCS